MIVAKKLFEKCICGIMRIYTCELTFKYLLKNEYVKLRQLKKYIARILIVHSFVSTQYWQMFQSVGLNLPLDILPQVYCLLFFSEFFSSIYYAEH